MIYLRVNCTPVGQPRPRAAMAHGGRHARVYDDPKHKVHGFKQAIRLAFAQRYAGFVPLKGPLSIAVEALMPRPQSKVWKTKPMPREWHITKPDADNILKAIKDALTGLAWVDDCQVCNPYMKKLFAAGGEPPGVNIEIRPLREISHGNGPGFKKPKEPGFHSTTHPQELRAQRPTPQ